MVIPVYWKLIAFACKAAPRHLTASRSCSRFHQDHPNNLLFGSCQDLNLYPHLLQTQQRSHTQEITCTRLRCCCLLYQLHFSVYQSGQAWRKRIVKVVDHISNTQYGSGMHRAALHAAAMGLLNLLGLELPLFFDLCQP